ncbi:MAG: hypothetical protein KBC11_01005 [Candidatus Pacebacteria bacterium]|nr:hypothetical protein [Candidatus Paceibacterota bacterium]
MGKIIAIIFLAVFAWYALPIMAKGIWVSPTMYPTDWWGDDVYDYNPQVATDGYGWFNFDPRKPADSGRTTASVFDSL